MTGDAASVLTWVVGGGGLLGGALRRCLTAAAGELFDAASTPWNDPVAARNDLRTGAIRLLKRAERTGTRWQTQLTRQPKSVDVSPDTIREAATADELFRTVQLAG